MLSSDSDKDGEDEGNDEDELHGLQSFQMTTNVNLESCSGIREYEDGGEVAIPIAVVL